MKEKLKIDKKIEDDKLTIKLSDMIDEGTNFDEISTTALTSSSTHVLSLFLKHGADIHSRDNNGYTPLHFAVKFNTRLKIIDFLIRQGAYIHAVNELGQTPFDLVHYNKNPGTKVFDKQYEK